ncbi:radical SAM/SPASM domain-containing protein [Vibrio spartinae]|uniref:S-adenosyl-L-methionine-dependent 2-deoxy-scyllo-inosamine dehydrogenase n=1 Tax=Vibrio spartinae TaxID=1918945 RepID=A0A1N6M8R5_9VIBR|nr:radical SAM/SPASM domain-containing protein [Vibrio spartinae]SIO95746.1 S-adenosyl-L-methionine-dependent 2-deoxy-scyllo-inosamine dehydrogenase [Vibrio spartinae]
MKMNIINKEKIRYIFSRIKRKGVLNTVSGINRKYIKSKSIEYFLSKRISNNLDIPYFPKILQIETRSGCNYSCSFCPTNKVKMKQGKMKQELFDKIIAQLKHFDGYISLFFRNEPLMDKRIIDWAQKIKNETKAKIIIQTNGSLLNEAMAQEISQYAELIVNDYTDDKVIINEIGKWENTISDNLIFITRNDYENLTNRAGNIGGKEKVFLKNSCVKPFTEFTITFSGTVVLCCQDWTEEAIIGDLNHQSILEIWNSNNLNEIREQLKKGNRIGICEYCDFVGV